MLGLRRSVVRRDFAPRPAKITRLTILTRTRTRVRVGSGAGLPRSGKNLRHPRAITTRWRTLPSFLPRAARSFRYRKRLLKNLPVSADSAPARRFGIQNTAKEPSTAAKEKAQKPRLRYNFLASA